MATEYLPWFALECHYTPQDVYGMPWFSLVQLSLVADDVIDRRKSEAAQAELDARRY